MPSHQSAMSSLIYLSSSLAIVRQIVICFLAATVFSSPCLFAQDPTTAKLSSRLYFPDAATEASSRTALHAEVADRVRAITAAADSSLSTELQKTESTYAALRRHGAYLKVCHLENIDDRAAIDATSVLETDESVLDAAIRARLLRVPDSSISSLGPYVRLAAIAHKEATHAFGADVEHYRGSVTFPFEQALADAYDHQMDSLEKVADLTATDDTKRRAALQRREQVYETAAPRTAALLGSLVDAENRDAASQGYTDAADRKYIELELTPTAVEEMLATLAKNASINRDYEALRAERAKKLLGLTTLVSSEIDLKAVTIAPIPFADARRMIAEGLQPLGADYTGRFAQLLDPANGRLDLSGGAHRAHTGTSISVYDAPVALYFSGYDGTLRAAETIAHEGGHAIHRELMNAGGSPIYEREGPHYLFEGFAEFNEMLVLDHIAQTAKAPTERIRALEMLAAALSHGLFDSAEEATFERNLYKASISKGLLERSQIDDIYRGAIAPYEIWPMSDAGTSRSWMRKSLLFDDPLYLINYLYATVVAAALYDKSHTDPSFPEKYNALLRRGFNADTSELLSTIGVNWNDPALVTRAVHLLQIKTEQLRGEYALPIVAFSNGPI